MPTTTIVLPLKPKKVQSVKEQLSSLHPELLLFLCKIKKLYVQSSNSYYKDASDICAISISHETQHVVVRSKKADSRVVHLAVCNSQGSDEEETCKYYIWRQSFPVKIDRKVHERGDIKEWTVSLAFPVGNRLTRGTSSSIGIFAYLPISMFTNFPFIIQVDFMLASSRESILLDNKWNLGILNCVPSAFVNAFTSFVKEACDSTLLTTAKAFKFLPVGETPIGVLDELRESIRLMLCDAKIMPCETFDSGLKFCKPLSALRILPDFRQLLIRMKKNSVSFDRVCSLKNHPVDASLDVEKFDKTLDFLCVLSTSESSGWYEKCICACKLVDQASEADYIEMLWVFANNEEIFPKSFFMKNEVFKYTDHTRKVKLCNAGKTKKDSHKILFAVEPELHAWLNSCNSEFSCLGNLFLLPNETQAALVMHEQSSILIGFLSETDLSCLILRMLVIDRYNTIQQGFNSPSKCVLPDEIGKRIFDMTSCVLRDHSILDEAFYSNHINLYLDELGYLGVTLGMDDVQKVAMTNFKAVASSEMSKNCAISLLMFIGLRKERNMLDSGWLAAMMKGRWLRTSQGSFPPNISVLLHSESESEAVCRITSLPLIDRLFYGSKLESFSTELSLLGVRSDQQVYELVPAKLIFPVNPALMKSSCGIFLLECIRHSQSDATSLIEKLQTQPWLKTTLGFQSPTSSILPSPILDCLLGIIEVPLVDEVYYGRSILSYTNELKALGVGSDFNSSLKIVASKIHELSASSQMSPSNVISLLQGIRDMLTVAPSRLHQVREALSGELLFKTRCGYRRPSESILSNQLWASISLIIDDLPIIDSLYHDIDIYEYQDELEVLGVIVGLEEGAHYVAIGLTRSIEVSQVSSECALTLLRCIRILMSHTYEENFPLAPFLENIMASEFLKTSRGNKPPKQCVLLQPQWKDILQFTDLPFLDEVYYGNHIYEYHDELKSIGVKVNEIEVCAILFKSLYSLTDSSFVKRYYNFLCKYSRESEFSDETDDSKVWIPCQNGFERGKWVSSKVCIVYDGDKIFGTLYYCLNSYYDEQMLPIFPQLFGAAEVPEFSHYMQLWHSWLKRENKELTSTECHSFWGCILNNWNSEIENAFKKNLTELPTVSSFFTGIRLVNKEKLFLPDDLFLKRMFMSHEKCPSFVWLPKSSISVSLSITPVKIQLVYNSLGVQRLSSSVEYHVKSFSVLDQGRCFGLKDKLISRGLMMIILAYLSSPEVNMGVNMRHKTARSVLNLSVQESGGPILLKYKLDPPDCEPLKVESRKLVHWDKESSTLLIDQSSYARRKLSMEFGSCFSQQLSEGILAQQRLSVEGNDLRMMIQLGFDYEFEQGSVEILLTRENLELFIDDQKFIDGAFTAKQLQMEGSSKRFFPPHLCLALRNEDCNL
ncbi:Muramidase-released protein, partial [Bienertia sinuspersici]